MLDKTMSLAADESLVQAKSLKMVPMFSKEKICYKMVYYTL